MHESFKRRIASLEEARKLQDGEPQIISIGFVHGDGTPVEATVVRTSDCAFEVFRLEGEDEDTFRARAHAEARAAPSKFEFSATWKEIHMHNERSMTRAKIVLSATMSERESSDFSAQ